MLRKSRRPDGFWQVDISYMKSAWVEFDELKKQGHWISYAVRKSLKKE